MKKGEFNSMKVRDLILLTGGRTKVRMIGTTKKDVYVEVWTGIVDDVEHVSGLEGEDLTQVK